jgi:endonuclease/exonuclease/phosphatase family metal-dependent hydrolase
LRPTKELLALWKRYRDGTVQRVTFERRLQPIRREIDALLLRGYCNPLTRGLPNRGAKAFPHALQVQENDWRRLRRKYPQDVLCVAGDFNQDLGPRLYTGTALGRSGLRKSLSNVALHCLTGEEVDPVAKLTANARRNIDHICLDSRFGASSAVRSGAWPNAATELKGLSDHFGVWVDVDELT